MVKTTQPIAPTPPTRPKEGEPLKIAAVLTQSMVFFKEDLIPIPDRPDHYAVRFPAGAESILSPKADGTIETRSMDYVGSADETAVIKDTCIVFENVAGSRLAFRLFQ